jgi:hypothetical protein
VAASAAEGMTDETTTQTMGSDAVHFGHLPVSDACGGVNYPDVVGDAFGAVSVDPVEPVLRPVLRLVKPVPQWSKKAKRETGSTRSKRANVQPVPQIRNARNVNDSHPPSIPGCKWKPSGLSGWELYTRRPSISANGKRSSKHKYLAYYSREAVRRLHNEREKTANARRA